MPEFPSCPSCRWLASGPAARCLACAVPDPLPGWWCSACGQEAVGGRACPNPWCARADRAWSVVWSVGTHTGALRHVLASYKYRHDTTWAPILARLVAGWLRAHACAVEEFDLIVPVPAYTGPGARRTWDPLAVVASQLAAQTAGRWEVAAAMAKVAETPAMAGTSLAARRRVAEGPLRSSLRVRRPALVDGARVLVLDDVLTAGGTLREVARALRMAGAEEVAGLVLARPVLGRGLGGRSLPVPRARGLQPGGRRR